MYYINICTRKKQVSKPLKIDGAYSENCLRRSSEAVIRLLFDRRSECGLVEAGRVVRIENVVLLDRVAAVESFQQLLGGHGDADVAICESAGGAVAAAAERQTDLAFLHGAHPGVCTVGLAAERELELLPVGLNIAGQQVERSLSGELEADDVGLFNGAIAQRGADDAGVGRLGQHFEVGLDMLYGVLLLVMPRGGLLVEDSAVKKFLIDFHAAVVHCAVVAGEVIGRETESALEVCGHADQLAGGGLVLAELYAGDLVELFRGLDELHRDRVLGGTESKEYAVAELFPLFFGKLHIYIHSIRCSGRANHIRKTLYAFAQSSSLFLILPSPRR